MPEQKNKFLFEIAGVLAIILSLLFVAYQIQQANRIALANAEIEIRNNYASVNELVISDPELTRIFEKSNTEPENLTNIEKMKLTSFVSRMFNVYSAIDIAYSNGMATEETYGTMFDSIRFELSSPYMRDAWRQNIETYPSGKSLEFIQYMTSLLEEYD